MLQSWLLLAQSAEVLQLPDKQAPATQTWFAPCSAMHWGVLLQLPQVRPLQVCWGLLQSAVTWQLPVTQALPWQTWFGP